MEILVYKTQICPYCVRAKKLLDSKGVQYTEIDVSNDSDLRQVMTQKSGGRTSVPQIFINQQHIGGCDDLYALEKAGELDKILGLI